jgi:CDP-glycerol glycerophosphotransferase (TagB/SpsB family)
MTRLGALASPLVRAARRLDVACQRTLWPDARAVVFDARSAMEYGMMAPVHRRLLADPRVATALMSSDRPDRAAAIFREAPREVPILSPREAMTKRFDAYLAADFVWASLPRGTARVQMFHGVAGKFSREYDRPDRSMRQWHRLFFINGRRLENYIATGAIDRDSASSRLVGMPKSDCLLDGTLTRDGVLRAHGIDTAATTVLYAPTWTRFSSLNVMGEEIVRRLIDAGYHVLVKLHELSLDAAVVNSGGVDWLARLQPLVAGGRGRILTCADASPWLVASDVLITDHSSIGFEYLLLDRPLIRVAMPRLLTGADVGAEYVDLMTRVSTTAESPAAVVEAVDRAVADRGQLSDARRAVAAELFHAPGRATDRAIEELYALMELELRACVPAERAQVVPAAAERVLSGDRCA